MGFAFKVKPWKHQLDAFEFAFWKQATMLAMDMGTGKSATTINLLDNWSLDQSGQLLIKNIFILCPKSVIDVWPDQFNKHAFFKYNVVPLIKGSVMHRTSMAADELLTSQKLAMPLVLITNYECFRMDEFFKFCMRVKWDVVICDESSRIKSAKGKTSRYLARLAVRVDRRLCLTGTPMPHSPLDVWAQYRFLDPNIYGTSYTRFKMRYAILGGFEEREVVGYQHMDELNLKFYSIAFRVKKRDVLDLPEETTIIRRTELSIATRKIYKSLERDFIAGVQDGIITASNALVKLLRLQQLTGGFAVTEEKRTVSIGDEKSILLKDVLEEIGSDESIVVFAQFTEDLRNIARVSRELGLKYFELSGRLKQLKEWQDGDSAILGVQIQAGGMGVDMTKSCYAIYYSTGFNLGNYEQSKARLHRPGQTRNVTYTHLVIKDTIDERVYGALLKRKNIVESVLKELIISPPPPIRR